MFTELATANQNQFLALTKRNTHLTDKIVGNHWLCNMIHRTGSWRGF